MCEARPESEREPELKSLLGYGGNEGGEDVSGDTRGSSLSCRDFDNFGNNFESSSGVS